MFHLATYFVLMFLGWLQSAKQTANDDLLDLRLCLVHSYAVFSKFRSTASWFIVSLHAVMLLFARKFPPKLSSRFIDRVRRTNQKPHYGPGHHRDI
jgi:hypothetical protein